MNASYVPSKSHLEEAMTRLCGCGDLVMEFLEARREETGSHELAEIFALQQDRGLPMCNKTERDDELWDQYDQLFDSLLGAYRAWLGPRLMTEAYVVMQQELDEAAADAAEESDAHLNGGW